MSKTKGQTFRYHLGKLNQNVVVSFPNLSTWKQTVAIWSEMIFSVGQIRERAQTLWFIPVRCRNVCGTFVEHLFLYCFDITTRHSLTTIHSQSRWSARLFSSRPNWVPPAPSHPQTSVFPPRLVQGEGGGVKHSLSGDGVGGPNSDEGTLWYSRYICTLCIHWSQQRIAHGSSLTKLRTIRLLVFLTWHCLGRGQVVGGPQASAHVWELGP